MGEVIYLHDFKAGKVKMAPPAAGRKMSGLDLAMEVAKSTPAWAPAIVKKVGNVEAFDYGTMMRRSLWTVMYAVLTEAAVNGLPKDSVILINFKTTHHGVVLSDALKQRFPADLTIMLDAWWENLVVTSEGFEVTLNFSDVKERMTVPFEAVRSFQDTPVGFGVGFDQPDEPTPPSAPLIA